MSRPLPDRFYAKVGDFAFNPPPTQQEPVYPKGENAERMNILWDWATEKFGLDDWRVTLDDGATPYRRWLTLEGIYANDEDELDLPGEPPEWNLFEEGLI